MTAEIKQKIKQIKKEFKELRDLLNTEYKGKLIKFPEYNYCCSDDLDRVKKVSLECDYSFCFDCDYAIYSVTLDDLAEIK